MPETRRRPMARTSSCATPSSGVGPAVMAVRIACRRIRTIWGARRDLLFLRIPSEARCRASLPSESYHPFYGAYSLRSRWGSATLQQGSRLVNLEARCRPPPQRIARRLMRSSCRLLYSKRRGTLPTQALMSYTPCAYTMSQPGRCPPHVLGSPSRLTLRCAASTNHTQAPEAGSQWHRSPTV